VTGRLRTAAPFLDAACLVLFVVVGRGRHEVAEGLGWFVRVLWPLAVGWYGAALLTRLYVASSGLWPRLLVTWAAGITVALVLRAAFLDRQPFSTFALVLFGFVALLTFGWRAVALAVRRLTPARV
jgi:hypothetical protein